MLPRQSIKEGQIGQWIIDPSDSRELNEAFSEVEQTSVGRKYMAEYYTEETYAEDRLKILNATQVIFSDYDLSSQVMTTALQQLMLAGEIVKRPDLRITETVEPVEEDTRPRGSDGRFLSEEDLRFQEYQHFVDDHGMAEIRIRARSDFSFGDWYRNSFRQEIQTTVGDAVTPAGAPREEVGQTQALIDFVRVYNAEPISNLRPRSGMVTMAGEQVPYSVFLDLVSRATDAKLI